jgi:lipid-binding SYLF domain-containing protein
MRLPIYVIMAMTFACGGAPKSSTEQANLQREADTTLQTMLTKDPSLHRVIDSSAGYVVFPHIGKGGFIAGGAHGRGVLYEHGRPAGFVGLDQASIGAQIGAQSFEELIVFRHGYDVQKLKGGTYSLGGNVSAVVLTAGVGGSADFTQPVSVYVVPRGGVMAELSVAGQRITYQPAAG